ncbi:MAG: serine hydrolase, partial [Pseudomonadota bacterium]
MAILLAIALHVPMAHAKPHLVIDLSNGRVLAQKDAFHPWHPASLTKLMTAYSAMKAVERGEVLLTSPVRISRAARKQPPSRMGYGLGTTVTLENALKLLLIKSANDISVAIGETISGTSEAFAAQMTADAKALGMTGSRFENPHGLHHPRQVTTARDMAVLVSVLHRQFPRLGTMLASPSVSAPKRNKEGKLIRRTKRSRPCPRLSTGYGRTCSGCFWCD